MSNDQKKFVVTGTHVIRGEVLAKAGDVVYEVPDPYSLASDDWRLGGVETKAVSRTPEPGAFYFTIPVALLALTRRP